MLYLFKIKYKFIYYNLQSSNIEQTINNTFIPGGEITDELIVQNAEAIEDTLKKIHNYTPGVYFCSWAIFI